MIITRNEFTKGLTTDDGAFPCPRCRNPEIHKQSHPACGQRATCGKCGARGPLEEWNDGSFCMEREKGKDTFKYIDIQEFKRPPSEKVVLTFNARKITT